MMLWEQERKENNSIYSYLLIFSLKNTRRKNKNLVTKVVYRGQGKGKQNE